MHRVGIASCQKYLQYGGKLLVGLHTYAHAAFLGSRLNPMVRIALELHRWRRGGAAAGSIR